MTCKLFQLSNKRLFAEMIQADLKSLEEMACLPEKFYRSCKVGKNKQRDAEVPVEALKKVQRRLKRLLDDLQGPDYRHCGTRGRSYKSNAASHAGAFAYCSLDIKSYYKSSKREDVFRFFHYDLLVAEDVAWLLTDLTTFKGFLPTGSPSSQAIAFWSHIHTFDALMATAASENQAFTVYVDDLTFSSTEKTQISPIMHLVVAKNLRPTGLKIKRSKVRYSRVHQDSFEITGAISKRNGSIDAPNRLKNRLFTALDEVGRDVAAFDEKGFRSNIGLLRSIRMLEPNSLPRLYNAFIIRERELNKSSAV